MEVLIKNVRIVDEDRDENGDLYIKSGLIRELGNDLRKDCPTIDGKDFCLMPSFIDIHAHFREPGLTNKEDIESGSRSALRGGYTMVNLMGNTKPIVSSMDIVRPILKRAKNLDLIDIHQCVSITKDFDGQSLEHLDQLDSEIKIITDDGMGIKSNIVMYHAFSKAREKDLIILTHAEDEDLTSIDYRISENIISFRDIYLSEVVGAKLHLTHVSTKEAIEGIRISKSKGNKLLTCDVTPHHISIWDNDYKVNPPIREKEDVLAIIEAIKDGTVDAIGTDHAPHTEEDKLAGSPGLVGLETAFPVTYTSLVRKGHIDLMKLSKIMSANPARILGVKKGRIKEAYDGDLVLVDLDREETVNPEDFLSKGKNTIFKGMKFYGKVLMTLRKGEVKYKSKDFKIGESL